MPKIKPLQFLIYGLVFVVILNVVFYVTKQEELIPDEPAAIAIRETGGHEWVEITDADFVMGDKDVALEIVIYDDVTKKFAPEYFESLQTIEEEYRGQVKIAYRLFSIDNGDLSLYMNSMLVCAGEQGMFYELYNELMQASRDGRLTRKYGVGLSSDYSLELKEFASCMDKKDKMVVLDKWKDEAEEHTIIGAPTTFINKNIYPGAVQLDDFVDSGDDEKRGLRSIINHELSITN